MNDELNMNLQGLNYDPYRPLNQTYDEEKEQIDWDIINTYKPSALSGRQNANLEAFDQLLQGPQQVYVPGYGDSIFDPEGTLTESELSRLDDIRAQRQPAMLKLAAGLGKFATTAAATVRDNTLGLAVGLGQGVANVLDDSDITNFRQGLWDNAVTNEMAKFQDAMETAMPNYRSSWENDAAWFEKLGTMNFWADGVIKNLGFMAGTAASMYLTGGISNALLSGVNVGKAGKFATTAARAILSAHGEAAIEAVNSMRTNKEAIDTNTKIRRKEVQDRLQQEYLKDAQTIVGSEGTQSLLKPTPDGTVIAINNLDELDQYYRELNQELDTQISNYEDEEYRRLTAAGNAVYGMNVAWLTLSNSINMNSLLKGGYNTNKTIADNLKRYVGNVEARSAKEFAQGVLQGTARYAQEEVQNLGGKTVARGLMNAAVEGIEEGVQAEISTTNEMRTQAQLNKYAHNTILGAEINPGVSEQLAEYSQAIAAAYEEKFGSASSPGWEEVAIGAFSGGLGMPTVKRRFNPKTKSYENKFVWNTSFTEARDQLQEGRPETQALADNLNEVLSNPESNIVKNFRHATAQAMINQEQNKAVEAGDIQEYKNLEIQNLVENLFYMRDQGKIEDYKAIIDALAGNVDDETVNQIIALTTEDESGKSPLQEKSIDDIKALYRDKAQSTKKKIEMIEDIMDGYQKDKRLQKYQEPYRHYALREITYQTALLRDTERRIADLTAEIDKLSENTDPLSVQQVKDDKIAIKKLERQKNSINDIVNTWLENPKPLIDRFDKIFQLQLKEKLLKEQSAVIAAYKNTKTLQDVLETYELANKEDKDFALEEAKKDASPETVALLTDFQNFMSDIDYIPSMVEAAYSDMLNSPLEQAKTYAQQAIKFEIDSLKEIADEFLDSNDPRVAQNGYANAVRERATELRRTADEAAQDGDMSLATYARITADNFDSYANQIEQSGSVREAVNALRETKAPTPETATPESAPEAQPEVQPETPPTIQETKDLGVPTGQVTVDGYDNLVIHTIRKDDEDSLKRQGTPANSEADSQAFYQAIGVYRDSGELGALKAALDMIMGGLYIRPKAAEFVKNALIKERAEMQKYYNDNYGKPVDLTQTSEEAPAETPAEQPQDEATTEEPQEQNPNTIDKVSTEESSEQMQFADVSNGEGFRGNTYPKYVRTELTQRRQTEYTGTNPNFQWAQKQSWYSNIQTLIDNYLSKLDSNTAIRLISPKGNRNLILLGIKYEGDNITNNIPRDAFVNSIVTTNDGEYLIIGIMGYENEKSNTPVANNFQTVAGELISSITTDDDYWVSPNMQTQIKSLTEGTLVAKDSNDARNTRSLAEMLNDPAANPHKLQANDLSFIVIEGNKENPETIHTKPINVKPTMIVHNAQSLIPGQVYLLVPTAKKGVYTTAYIMPQLFNQSMLNTPWGEDLLKLIRTMADTSLPVDIRQRAASDIRNLILFEKGHYFAVNDNGSVKVKDNQNIDTIDLGTNLEEAVATAITTLEGLKARANLKTSALETNPAYYVESGLITTDARVLGTIGANFYVYGLRQDTENPTQYVADKTQGPIKPLENIEHHTATPRQQGVLVFVNGVRYEFRDGGLIAEDGTQVANPVIVQILSGNFPKDCIITFEGDANTYYKISSSKVLRKHKEGFQDLSEDDSRKIIEKAETIKATKERETALQDEAKSINEQTTDITPTTQPEETPEEKPSVAPQSTSDGTSAVVNGEDASQLKDVKNLDNSKINPIFVKENRDLVKELLSLIKEKKDLEIRTPKDLVNWITKTFPDFKLETREDLENLINCKFR